MTSNELVQWIKGMESQGDYRHHAFYVSTPWQHLRKKVLKNQHYECQMCKDKGSAVPATTVHHIKTVHSYPGLALTESNLMAVCDDCHYKIHHSRAGKWNDEKW